MSKELYDLKLSLLESGGVDNWSGYGDALEGYYAYCEYVRSLKPNAQPKEFYKFKEQLEKMKSENKHSLNLSNKIKGSTQKMNNYSNKNDSEVSFNSHKSMIIFLKNILNYRMISKRSI